MIYLIIIFLFVNITAELFSKDNSKWRLLGQAFGIMGMLLGLLCSILWGPLLFLILTSLYLVATIPSFINLIREKFKNKE